LEVPDEPLRLVLAGVHAALRARVRSGTNWRLTYGRTRTHTERNPRYARHKGRRRGLVPVERERLHRSEDHTGDGPELLRAEHPPRYADRQPPPAGLPWGAGHLRRGPRPRARRRPLAMDRPERRERRSLPEHEGVVDRHHEPRLQRQKRGYVFRNGRYEIDEIRDLPAITFRQPPRPSACSGHRPRTR
jgi:hypothetical protein